ncbi:helix-turn-helix transcriptional regulator [Cellulomonas sp. C5510]|uniref:helix-turn-helix domain-containing protein n=1 Tax=Cellulomonas sp. C5510 TaxID=2871170 RepID=UPI001C96597D|nr:helix-turn-helix transcriptional regulator [Cellulomonas sp. C5510]QZN85341.1 LuxR C-terminal-related transcriptional regulator [Cellulomonas sp. C5510]
MARTLGRRATLLPARREKGWRMDVVAEVVAYLNEGVSVDVVGHRGSGRSRTADLVEQTLVDEGVPVLRLTGVPALRDRPLGGISAAGFELPRGGASSVGEVLAALRPRVRGRGAVIVVDDLDGLDPASAGVVAALRTTVPAPTLVTRRLGTERDEAVVAVLPAMQPGVRLPLAPLRFGEVQAGAQDLLGGPVDSSTVARLATKSGGIPGLVRALVTVGRRTGTLTYDGAVWRATAPLWSPELAHTLDGYLADLDTRAVGDLTLLAVAGPLDVRRVRALVDDARLLDLQRAGLVGALDGSGSGAMGLYPPLLGDHLVAQCPATLRLEIEARLADEAPHVPHPARAAAGARVHSPEAVVSKRLADHWEEVRDRLQEAWAQDRGPAAGAQLLEATLAAPQSAAAAVDDQVLEVYRGTAREIGGDADRAQLEAWYAVYLAVGRRRLVDARRVLAEAEVAVPSHGAYLRATGAHLGLLLDRVPKAPRTTAAEDRNPLNAEASRGVAVETELARGRTAAARSLLAASAPELPIFHRHHLACEGLARLLAADEPDLATATTVPADVGQLASDPASFRPLAYVTALGLAVGGRVAELDDWLSSALTVTSVGTLQKHYHVGLLSVALLAALWRGEEAYAVGVARQAAATRQQAGPLPLMASGDALVALAADDADGLWSAVDEHLAGGYLAAAVFLAVEALERRPDAVRARAVAELGTRVDGGLLEALVDYARALGEQDEAALAASAERFERCGAVLYTVRAGVARARVLRQRGQTAAAVAQVEAAWATSLDIAQHAPGVFAPYLDALELSPREVDVLRLVVAGLGTAEIAAELTLSVRTVENHVFSTYRKIGVEGRADLLRVAATWLGPRLRSDA